MSIFKKEKPLEMKFSTRAEAFNFMLNHLMTENGEEPLSAAKKANEFAEIFAINNGIPTKIEPELKGVDKYISVAEKIGNYAESHPKAVEVLLGLGTFLAGLFTGKAVENNANNKEEIPPSEPIDFDKID